MKQWNSFEVHPSEESVLAALEGGMAPEQSAKIREHVSVCSACLNRLRQLQAELQWFQAAAFPPIPPSVLDFGLKSLSKRISDWNEAHPDISEANTDFNLSLAVSMREWLEAELSIYLGLHAAKSLVLQACGRPQANANDLTAIIEPVVSGFFGRQTGNAIAAQVVRLCNHAQQMAAQSEATQ